MYGCFKLVPDTLNRFRAYFKDIPVLNNKYESFTKALEKIGFDDFELKMDELIDYLDDEYQEFLKAGSVFLNFTVYNSKWYSTDIFDNLGNRIVRASENFEIKAFLKMYKKSYEEKIEELQSIISALQSEYRYDPDAVESLTGIRIPPSDNLIGPDYRKATDNIYQGRSLIYGNDKKYANIKVVLSGVRSLDESAAFAAAGITASAEKKEILKLYVWHHLDDFDPNTGKATMQLVLKEFHNSKIYGSTFDHMGGVKVWESFYLGVKYKK